MVVIIIIYSALIFIWKIKKEMNSVIERSPLIILTVIVFSMISFLFIPILKIVFYFFVKTEVDNWILISAKVIIIGFQIFAITSFTLRFFKVFFVKKKKKFIY